jgi:hypothetical protein
MKCEKCPFHAMKGVENDLNWCKLYTAEAPVEGCEAERNALIREQELMQQFFEKEPGE